MATNDIERTIASYMRECIDDNEEALEENVRAAGAAAVRMLKRQSASRTGRYRKGWRCDVTTGPAGVECTVNNRAYQLTHLLENGHRITNQTGADYGSVPGDGVIAGVADRVARQFMAGGDAT